jgi:hypothetical protein
VTASLTRPRSQVRSLVRLPRKREITEQVSHRTTRRYRERYRVHLPGRFVEFSRAHDALAVEHRARLMPGDVHRDALAHARRHRRVPRCFGDRREMRGTTSMRAHRQVTPERRKGERRRRNVMSDLQKSGWALVRQWTRSGSTIYEFSAEGRMPQHRPSARRAVDGRSARLGESVNACHPWFMTSPLTTSQMHLGPIYRRNTPRD